METDWLLSIAHLDFLLDVRHRDPVWGPEGSASRDSHFFILDCIITHCTAPLLGHGAMGPF